MVSWLVGAVTSEARQRERSWQTEAGAEAGGEGGGDLGLSLFLVYWVVGMWLRQKAVGRADLGLSSCL